jgi:hypothetical protein
VYAYFDVTHVRSGVGVGGDLAPWFALLIGFRTFLSLLRSD